MKTIAKFLVMGSMLLSAITMEAQTDQPIEFGIRGGINLSNFGGKDIKLNDNTKLDDKTALVGYMAGITLDIPMTSMLYLQSGVDFTTKGAKHESDVANITFKSTPYYLQLPVHLAVKLPLGESSKFVVGAGGFVAYGLGGTFKTEGSIGSIDLKNTKEDFFGDNTYKRMDYGVGINAGFEVGKLTVGCGYDLGLANIAQNELKVGSTVISNSDNKVRTQNAYLVVGIRF